MKRLLFFIALLATSLLAQNPSITAGSVTADNIGHTTARLVFIPNGPFVNFRVRAVPNSASCSGGFLAATSGAQSWNVDNDGQTNWSMPVYSLSPNTNYQLCPEVTNDNTNWFGGVGVNITTDPTPAIHPAKPVAPFRFNIAYPDTTGYRVYSVASGDDCTQIYNAIQWAINDPTLQIPGDTNACHDQKCRGVIISVAANSVCTGRAYVNTRAVDAVGIPAANFNTTTHNITIPNIGLTEGQVVTWAGVNGNIYGGGYTGSRLPAGGSNYPDDTQPFAVGQFTYVHLVSSDATTQTIQIYANNPFGTACNAGHSLGPLCPRLWSFTNQGDGMSVLVPWYLQNGKWERNLKWIIIRTSTPDSQFVPEHVRPQGPRDQYGKPTEPSLWAPKMAKMQLPANYKGNEQHNTMLFSTNFTYDNEAANNFRASHIRFVGMELTYEPTPMDAYIQNPAPGFALINTDTESDNILFDRCWIHGNPPPSRTYKLLLWNGTNEGIIDTYMNNMLFPRQYLDGLRLQ